MERTFRSDEAGKILKHHSDLTRPVFGVSFEGGEGFLRVDALPLGSRFAHLQRRKGLFGYADEEGVASQAGRQQRSFRDVWASQIQG